jgi:hypothetical protein
LACACGGGSTQVDARSNGDAPPDAPQKKFGSVAILEDKASNSTIELANFGADHSVLVAERDEGSCHIELRKQVMEVPLSGGMITISGGASGAVSLSFDQVAGGYIAMASGLTYATNEQLTIYAPGDTVPAFSAQITFPAEVTLTSGSPTTLSKSGFTATWTPTTGTVVIAVSQYPSGGPALNLVCTFDGAAGTGAVPAAALTDLLTTVSAGVGVGTRSKVVTMAGEYPVNLEAMYQALNRRNLPVQP